MRAGFRTPMGGAFVVVATVLVYLGVVAGPSESAFPGANGAIVFVSDRDGNNEIYGMNPDGTGVVNLSRNTADDRWPAWSADGRRIAFASDRGGGWDLYLMGADGSGVVRVTNEPSFGVGRFQPSWSPDGTKIAFGARPSHPSGDIPTYAIFTINLDGTGLTQLTESPDFDEFDELEPAWSPDGSKIAFKRLHIFTGFSRLAVINADGTGETLLPAQGIDPSWSPDGSKIAVTGGINVDDVWVMNADGSAPRELIANNSWSGSPKPAWSPDGTKIVFARGRLPADPQTEIVVANADGTGLRQLTDHPAFDGDPDWQPLTNTSPNCADAVIDPSQLWPPNKTFVLVSVHLNDQANNPVPLTITGVTQDEPIGADLDAQQGPAPDQVYLRAQRDGDGDGRIYRVAFRASNGGGSCEGSVIISVPHHKDSPATDSGLLINSFGS